MIEVLNSFWALQFEGTVLKVIWVSRPRQIDRLTDSPSPVPSPPVLAHLNKKKKKTLL